MTGWIVSYARMSRQTGQQMARQAFISEFKHVYITQRDSFHILTCNSSVRSSEVAVAGSGCSTVPYPPTKHASTLQRYSYTRCNALKACSVWSGMHTARKLQCTATKTRLTNSYTYKHTFVRTSYANTCVCAGDYQRLFLLRNFPYASVYEEGSIQEPDSIEF